MTNTLSHFVYTRASTFSAGFSKPGSSGLPPWPRISRPHRPAHHQAKGLCPQHCHFQLSLSLSLDVTILNQIEALEAIAGVMGVGFETQNKYKIKNSLGQVPSSFICRQLDPVFERKTIHDFKLAESFHLECVQSQGGLRVLHSYVVRTKSAF